MPLIGASEQWQIAFIFRTGGLRQWKIQGRGVKKALENPGGGVKKNAEIQGVG